MLKSKIRVLVGKVFCLFILLWLVQSLPAVSQENDYYSNLNEQMITSHQLLVVAPNYGFNNPTDEFLESLAYKLMDAKRPAGWEIPASFTEPMYWLFVEKSKKEGIRIDLNKPLVIDLLRRIYTRDFTAFLPEASIVKENDPILKKLSCADGEFKVNVVYVAHPADSKYFIRLANFHSYLLQDKLAEFINLAGSLGAKEITLVDSKKQNLAGKGSISWNDSQSILNNIGLDIEANKDSQNTINVFTKSSIATALPIIPNKLKWYFQEPLWQAMALARTRYWVDEFRIRFTYLQDFSINSNLNSKIQFLGLNAGGKFNDIHQFEQELIVKFFTKQEYSIINHFQSSE